MRALSLLLALACPLVALAVPTQLTHSGRLLDNAGTPLEGELTLEVALFTEATGGSAVWNETVNVTAEQGYFSTALGATTPLDASVLDGQPLWVELTVSGSPALSPRLPLRSVPYAVRAGVAESAGSVSGGVVNASEVQVNGATVIGSDGRVPFAALTGVPEDADSFAALSCSAGETLVATDTGWDCAPAAEPLDEAAVEEMIENGALSLAGSVQVGEDDATCDDAKLGAIRWSDRLEACTPAGWQAFHFVANGGSEEAAAVSCAAIKADYPDAASGRYWLRGTTGAAYTAWCDMTNAGGGWTLLLSANAAGTTFGNNAPAWKTNTPVGTPPTTAPENAEYRGPAYGALPTNEIRLCFQNLTRCYTFNHARNIPLQAFFRDNVTYTAYALNSVSHPNTGADSLRTAYLTALGVTASTTPCYWLGINDQNSYSGIGLLGDANGGCSNQSGTYTWHDDLAVGLGLQSCVDANGCDRGGSGHANGQTRGFGGVDNSGAQGPWFVLGR
jgi:hypothetical protein